MKIYKIEIFKNWLFQFKSKSDERIWKQGKRPLKNKNYGKH